jgi:hypothetical protein
MDLYTPVTLDAVLGNVKTKIQSRVSKHDLRLD